MFSLRDEVVLRDEAVRGGDACCRAWTATSGLRTPAVLSGLALGRWCCLGGGGVESPKLYIPSFGRMCNFGIPPSRGGMRLVSVTRSGARRFRRPRRFRHARNFTLHYSPHQTDAISSSLSKNKICVSKIESSARGQGLRPTACNTGSSLITVN